MKRIDWWILFLGALGLRLAYVFDVRGTVGFASPVVDAHTYDQIARAVVAGGLGALELPFYQPPLYSLFLAAIYALTDGSYLAPRLVQALLGAGTTLAVAALAARAGGGRLAPWLAGGLYAAYAPALYFESQLLPPAWVLPLTAAGLWLMARADQADSPRRAPIAAGLLLGLAAAFRPTGLLVAAGAATWWWCGRSGRDVRARSLSAASFGLAVLLPLLPFTAANWLGADERILVSYNGGINFYLGNGADSDSLTAIQPGHHWDKLQIEPWRAGVGSRAEESAYWFGRGWSEATADPGAWVAALGRKVLRFTDARETARNTDFEADRRESRLLGPWMPGFLAIAPLAALGFFALGATGPSRRLRSLLTLTLLAILAQNLLFFVAGRYRLEAVPVLCVLAGAGTAWAVARVRSGAGRTAFLALAVAAGVTAVVAIDWLGERAIDESRVALNDGVASRRAGLHARSTRAFRTALRHDPASVDAHRLLAENLVRDGNLTLALEHLDRALALAPDYVQVLLTSGRCLEELGRFDEAGPRFRRAVEADPFLANARLGYGVWLARRGEYDAAEAQFREGLRIDPTRSDLAENLRNLDRARRGS